MTTDFSKYAGGNGAELGNAQGRFLENAAMIQSFYPPGVGARELRECLLIQLKREGKEGSLEHKIVSEQMEDLGRRCFRNRASGGDQCGGRAKGSRTSYG